MIQFISWAIIKRLTESESVLPKRGVEARFQARLQPYGLYELANWNIRVSKWNIRVSNLNIEVN